MASLKSAGTAMFTDFKDHTNAMRRKANQAPYLTPYLGLRARLSQVWINRWTVLLLLILVRLLFAIAGTDNNLASARREALSACTSVEHVGSAMASMPHYMSTGMNRMTAHGIEKAVHGLQEMVTLTVTGVEEIIVFVIGMMTNTYLCLITLAVGGSLHYAVDLLNNAQDDLNNALKSIGNDLSHAGTDLQNGINGLTKGINTFLGSSIPTVDFSKEVTALNNFKLPASLNDDLAKLNRSIPSFDEVKNVTETGLRFPFEELKKLIRSEMGNFTMDDSVFPVPQKKALNFCSDDNDINNFFDGLVEIEHVAEKVFIALLVIAAIAACVPMAWWEIKRWRSLQERARLVGMKAYDPMDAVYMSSRPYTSRFGWWVASKFSSPRRQIIARWAVAYPTSVPALFILSIALAGLFSCMCQYILLKAIEKEVPILTGKVANFTDKIVDELNNASALWATDTNQVILDKSAEINQNLLGWVNTSTIAVNQTLNTFVDETMNILNLTFGNTPLYGPVTGVFNCLIELKVRGIQSGLTWVHDNAHVNFPLLPNDTFTLTALAQKSDSDDAQNFLADPGSSASDNISAAVERVTDLIAKAIRQEAIISTMILVAWLCLVLIGILRACFSFGGRDKVRGEAGNEYNSHQPYQIDGGSSTTPEIEDLRMTAPGVVSARPQSAAPPYTYSDPDVNKSAPYTLNPHPFPRSTNQTETETAGSIVNHDRREQSSEESSRRGWPFQRHLTTYGSPERRNEKGGSRFVSNEKEGGFI